MINWTKAFETGSAKLDLQHRLLIDNINLLEEELKNPHLTRVEAAFANRLLGYLEAYANIHFDAEEKCMESYRCPVHAQNRQEHERFRGFTGGDPGGGGSLGRTICRFRRSDPIPKRRAGLQRIQSRLTATSGLAHPKTAAIWFYNVVIFE